MKAVSASDLALTPKKLLKGFEGGAVYTAEAGGKFYLILDESSLASMLDAEDLAGLELVTCLEFETTADRANYMRQRGWQEKP